MHSNKTGNMFDFFFFFFVHTLICFLSPPSNFWLNFKHFSTKILHFLPPVKSKNIGIWNVKGWFLKITLPEKPLMVLYTNCHISKSRSMNLILVPNYSWKCALTMISKTHFPQNVNCSMFLGVYHISVWMPESCMLFVLWPCTVIVAQKMACDIMYVFPLW